jgi:hypothetical protein
MRDDHPLIPTYTGKRVDPMHLDVEDICIEDIAHHLSLINRFTGATDMGYSVAQHSLVVCASAPEHVKLPALLHDAPEAYMGDMSHPMKHHTLMGSMFREVERFNELQIERAFWLPYGSLRDPDVKAADEEAFDLEWMFFIERNSAYPFSCMPPKRAEANFLRRFHELVLLAACSIP